MAEEQLEGGITNAGRVVRVGGHLLRPSTPYSTSIQAFLGAVHDTGFTGAPRPLGFEADGRERLTFIEGEAPSVPYPVWCQSEAVLTSLVKLIRGLHDAGSEFDHGALPWSDALADPAGGPVVCHNDVEPANVVFRHGIAVGLIDFEFAAPGRPVYELAQLARFWVPIDDELEQARLGWQPDDRPARLRLIADAYGLDSVSRESLVVAIDEAIDQIELAVGLSVDAGQSGAVALWNRTGGATKFERRRAWWDKHQAQFAAALR